MRVLGGSQAQGARQRRRTSCAVFAVAVSLGSAGAFAQAPQAQVAQADALFMKAKRLADAGQMVAACPIFAESYKLDPTAVGVLFYMGACHESTGKIATAWTTFREARDAAERNQQPDRVRIADAHIAALEPRLPRMRLVLPKEALEQGWTIRRDDVVLSPALWDTDIPADPGMVRIEVLAPNHRPYATTALLLEGATVKVEIAALEPDAIQLRGIPVASDSGASASAQPVEPDRDGAWKPMHTAAVAVGGVGLIGLAIGTGFGVAASSDWDDANIHCDKTRTPWGCDRVGVDAHDSASSKASVSTAAFMLGGAAVATGAVLWILAPRLDRQPRSDQGRPEPPRPEVALAEGPGDVGLGLRRSF